MDEAAKLAGFIAAHAIWSVSDGEMLVPMIGSQTARGERKLDRIIAETNEASVARGRAQLVDNPHEATHAALAFDGYITLPDGKTDAVFVEARAYRDGAAISFDIAVPYQSAAAPGGFRVYRPKLLQTPPAGTDVQALLNEFWAGVDAHVAAAEVWTAALDQSR